MTVNLAQSTYLAWLASEESNRQAQVEAYRRYYDGNPPTYLTDRMAEFLNVERDKSFGINLAAVIVDTKVERLNVTGFAVKDETEAEDVGGGESAEAPPADGEVSASRAEQVGALLDSWWQHNRMDARQDFVYRAALRDREAFVVVSYDEAEQRPAYSYDFAFDGTSGVRVHRKPGTYSELAFASKRWQVDAPGGESTRRLNLYFPNRIEKWVNRHADSAYNEAFWEPYTDPDEPGLVAATITDEFGREYEASVAWWTEDGTETGEPLGVPIIPFINRDDGTGEGQSEIDNAIPINDGVNKTYIDMLASADMTGFSMFWTNGQLPSNVKVYPGAMIPVAPAEGAAEGETPQIGQLAAGNVDGLIKLQEWQVSVLAGITGTPQSRFTPAAVRPAEGTQKQEESALVARIEGLQKVWGNAWEDVQKMGLRVARAFGPGSLPNLDGLIISTMWAEAETRNEKEHVEAVALKVDKLAVPREQAWLEVGYSADDVRKMQDMKRDELAERVEEASATDMGRNANALETMGRLMGGAAAMPAFQPPQAMSRV